MNREVGLSSILGLGRQFGIMGGIVYIFPIYTYLYKLNYTCYDN